MPAVEAAKKKHEAIETDTAAYEERIQAIKDVARELEVENYHDIKRINARKDNILRLWSYLQELLQARRRRLEMNLTVQKLFQDMLHSIGWIDEMKVRKRGGEAHLLKKPIDVEAHAFYSQNIIPFHLKTNYMSHFCLGCFAPTIVPIGISHLFLE